MHAMCKTEIYFNSISYNSTQYHSFPTMLAIILPKSLYVTGPEKTGLIYTKYTHPYYGIYLFFCVSYLNSVSFIEILRIFCIYGEIFVKIVC